MKTNFILSLFLLSSMVSFSQTKEPSSTPTPETDFKPHRIGLILGSSSATGDFGSSAYTDPKAGFAEGGVHIGITYAYSFNENIALSFGYEGFGYTVDAQSLAISIDRKLQSQGQFPESTEVEIEAFGVGLLRVEPKFELKEKKVVFYFRPSIGLASMVVPQLTIRNSFNGETTTTIQSEYATDVEVTYGVNGGIELTLSDLVRLSLNLGYLSADDFEVEAVVDDGTQISTMKYSQPYSAFNVGINLGFNF